MSLPNLVYKCIKLWKNASKPPEQIQAESLAGFRRVLKQAWKETRFYPVYWGAHGITYYDLMTISPDDIPCITKADVRKHFAEIAAMPAKHTVAIHSSGSTGPPTTFLYSKDAITAIEANFLRLSNLGGKYRISWKDLPIRNIHAASVGTGYASTALLSSGLSKYHAKCIILNTSDPLSDWIERIGDFSPNYLSGYPSCLSLLMDLQSSGKISLRPLKIITGGEVLRTGVREHLQKSFGADVIDFYGCSESLLVGAGSSWYDGLFLFDDMNFCECDEHGHLILTPLYNRAFPLVRYRMDDLVEGFSKDSCGCLPFTHIDRVIGRDEDLLWFVNEAGERDFLHPLTLDDLDVPGLRAFQFVQLGDEAFRIDCLVEENSQLDGLLRTGGRLIGVTGSDAFTESNSGRTSKSGSVIRDDTVSLTKKGDNGGETTHTGLYQYGDEMYENIRAELCREVDRLLERKHLKNLHYEVRFCRRLQANPGSGKIPLTWTAGTVL